MKTTCPKFKHRYLLDTVRNSLNSFIQKDSKRYKISTVDCIMSSVAMFSQKCPSLLQFDKARQDDKFFRHNLKSLYGIERAPCDTQMRTRLDEIDYSNIRKPMNAIFSNLQRSGKLENWKFMGQFLISIDGTQFFQSKDIHCQYCCEKTYKKDTEEEYKIYHHQMVVAVIVHPETREVIPLDFEPICKEDGSTKNDCELNASKRLLDSLRKNHPQLKATIVYDGLASNAPFIKNIKSNRFNYILTAKDKDHKHLNGQFWADNETDAVDFIDTFENGIKRYRYMNNLTLNASNLDTFVNVLHTEESFTKPKQKSKKGKQKLKKEGFYKATWVTDLEITNELVRLIERGGRCRWKIENETFNTLKNLGYNFEHNYGHGDKKLSNLLAGIMLLAFLIDQCLSAFNLKFKACVEKCGSKIRLWDKLKCLFGCFYIMDWSAYYSGILDPPDNYLSST
jgi:hypothetical protein